MKLALIDYGSGNIHSVSRAVTHAATEMGIDFELVLTDRAEQVAASDAIILPGVGHFADCYHSLSSVDGLLDALHEAVMVQAKPFLGICVGMQLLADHGLEGGVQTDALGWIGGVVDRLPSHLRTEQGLKIPHMGWNNLQPRAASHRVLSQMTLPAQAYFVHSYFYQQIPPEQVLAVAEYGVEIPALIGKDNLLATQFHPEKSQQVGQAFLRSFLSWKP